MKKCKCLIYTAGNETADRRTLDLQISIDLIAFRKEFTEPAAVVIPGSCLESILEFRSAIIDRKSKHPAKSLSVLLLGYDKIPVIRGDFKITGQLTRSIRTLLQNAVQKGDDNIYFVAISDELFQDLKTENRRQVSTPAKPVQMNGIPQELKQKYLGESPEIKKIHEMIMLSAGNDEPVLITGETGTGKEIIAQSIHRYNRPGKPFQAINCGAIPGELLELTLFGYVKGSHHMALMDTKGLWEDAQDGTLFLDEIGDLALNHQVKILRALQEGKIRRIGGNVEIPVNARIICATNKNLTKEVREGNFRSDLLARLDVIRIEPPPLRKHLEDIPVISRTRWQEITKDVRPPLSEEFLEAMKQYYWPGNVRELENVIKKLHYLNPGNQLLEARHLQNILKTSDLRYRLEQLSQTELRSFGIDLWIEHRTRDFSPDARLFTIGDPVQICVKAEKECQLLLFDLGTSGDITFIPSNPEYNNRVAAEEEIRIPGTLKGNAGSETFFAFASQEGLEVDTEQWQSSEDTLRDILDNVEAYTKGTRDSTIAMTSISFEVKE